ncbi:MAG: metallophosphoesterase [Pseudomonadota bacterium]
MTSGVDIVQITDLHIHSNPEKRVHGRDSLATLQQVVDAIRRDETTPAIVLATGDLTDNAKPVAYDRLRPILSALDLPVYIIPGNHDLVPAMEDGLVGGAIHYVPTKEVGAWTLVFVDTTIPHKTEGHLDDQRLDALDRVIGEAGTPHVMVVMHHQPVPIGSPLDVCGLMNADALYDVLDRHEAVKGLLWGHIHHIHDSMRNGVRRLGTPATCAQFLNKMGVDATFTDEPPAYRRLRLNDDGTIDTDVVWVA